VSAATAVAVASGLRRRRARRRRLARRAEEDDEVDVEARFAELDEELDELKDKLTQELDARGAALSNRVEELLARAPAAAVRIEEEDESTAAASAASRRGGRAALAAHPALQRVAVCGVGGLSVDGVGQRLFSLLREASPSPADDPRWVDLEQAPDVPFEDLDACFLGARAVVVCPDVNDDRRRAVEGVRAGLKAAIASLPGNLSRMVLLSRIGAQSMKGSINVRSFFGLGYEGTITGLEDELTSAARRRGRTRPLSATIVRVGDVRPLEAAPGVRCLPGDASDGGCTSAETAAEALLQTLLLSVDTNVCVVDEPASGEAPPAPDWRELLLPYIGPEVWRREVNSATRAAIFAQSWAAEWFKTADEQGSMKDTLRCGLKTPVQLRDTPTGVIFKFRPLGTPSGREFEDLEEGGLEFVAERAPGGRARLRVKRCSYGAKAILKENSERAILRKFQEDSAEVSL